MVRVSRIWYGGLYPSYGVGFGIGSTEDTGGAGVIGILTGVTGPNL